MSLSVKKRAITQWNIIGVNYWPIYKCGSTTILNHFQIIESNAKILFDDEIKFKRSFAKQKVISPTTALKNELINFTVCRDPLERFKSMYKDMFLKRPKRGMKANIDINWSVKDFANYLSRTDDNELDIHFKSQVSFVKEYKEYLKVFKLENINNCLETLDIDPITFKHHNTDSYDIEISQDIEEIVKERYKEDFLFFKY